MRKFRLANVDKSLYIRMLVLITVLLLSSVLLISLLTYSLAKKNSFENAQQSNAAALTQQLSLIDQELESVSSLAANILMTQSYMFAEWENTLSVGSIIDLNNYLKQQRSLNPYIDSIYLYYDKLDQIITSGLQARPLAEFADRGWTSAYGGNVQRTQWLVNRETHPEVAVAKTAEAPASERRWITLVQTMPLIGKPIGAIVINIDQDRLLGDYLQAYSSSAGEMLVLGPSGEFLYGGDELRTNGGADRQDRAGPARRRFDRRDRRASEAIGHHAGIGGDALAVRASGAGGAAARAHRQAENRRVLGLSPLCRDCRRERLVFFPAYLSSAGPIDRLYPQAGGGDERQPQRGGAHRLGVRPLAANAAAGAAKS
ncbi:cache domain-containing protein [Cohnella rhizosphaerae]|uniref:Cache domain-containing protein n=1 Tax=Cohnella rhizosphaerae TaxID=1457232 RepID=A0A9X4KTI5_9BACL|nr:cache domain-containing protein [Cohnella rhizosphaerae]MDG0810498.1 cache domain-containing protein [Cohnella rhizosphaerae]